jgi:crotonobetainyl-CoA:carnitine CoA-transferase CaiB-like acyl-CoA transferase
VGAGFLSQHRVLDLTDERGLLAGRMLGQLGADVVQVEPPGGSRARRIGPLTNDPAPDNSLYWSAYASAKRGLVCDPDASAGRELILRLAAKADFLIESEPPGVMAARGLAFEDLAKVNPRLIQVSITPFGSHGPKAGWAASELTLWAAGGALFPARDGDGPPLRISVPQAWLHAAADGACGALIAHFARLRTGRGQHVDISAQVSVAEATLSLVLAETLGDPRGRRPAPGATLAPRAPSSWACLDGRVEMALGMGAIGGGSTNALFAWMRECGECDPALDHWDWLDVLGRLQAGTLVPEDLRGAREAIGCFFARRTAAELIAGALKRRILLTQVQTARTLAQSDHFRGRGAFETVQERSGARLLPTTWAKAPGAFAPLRPAPRVGEHTDEVIAEWLGGGSATPAAADSHDPRRPLEGLKVLELAWVVAGPRVGRALADYGATVVRVDSVARTDPARVVGPFPAGEPDYANSALWDNVNAGKLGLALDLTRPEARQVVLDLGRWADVVTESYAPGQLEKWGLAYPAFAALNPGLIMLSSSLMGQDGPLSRTAGFGNVGAAASGFQVLVGERGREPVGPAGPYTDFVAPRFSLALLLAALDHRRRTGEGVYIDAAQAEAGLQFLAPQIADYAATGRVAEALGNRDPHFAPHGVFACAGHESWLAIAVCDDVQWIALARLVGGESLAADARLTTAVGRKAHEDELESVVAAWTRGKTAAEAEAMLQSISVPAHVVSTSEEFCADPQIAALGHLVRQPEPHGRVPVVEASRFRLSATPGRLDRSAPPLGRDNVQVLRDFAGYDGARIDALFEGGVLR